MAKVTTKLITVASEKGGTAKTTTAVNLAHGLTLRNLKTLLVDLDPQAQCSTLLGLEMEAGVKNVLIERSPIRDCVRTTGRQHLYILPGEKTTTSAVQRGLDAAPELYGIDLIARVVRPQIVGLHYVVMDTAGSVNPLQQRALFACDVLVIPAGLDYMNLQGVKGIIDTTRTLHEEDGYMPLVYLLPTFHDERTLVSGRALETLQKFAKATDGVTCLGEIHRANRFKELAELGQTIFEAPLRTDQEERARTEYWETVLAVATGIPRGVNGR